MQAGFNDLCIVTPKSLSSVSINTSSFIEYSYDGLLYPRCITLHRQMAREGRDVISVCCMKNDAGNVVSDADGMKNIWRKYLEKLLNVKNDWDGEVDCPEVMVPHCMPMT